MMLFLIANPLIRLQPYIAEDGITQYNCLNVDPVSEVPLYQDAPYVAVEGYLQMKRPFEKPDPVNTSSS